MSSSKKFIETLLSLAFWLAIFKASLLMSQASISISKYFFKDIAIQPLPVQISINDWYFFVFKKFNVFSTKSSVSNRGIKTFSLTVILVLKKSTYPIRYWMG